MAQSLDNTLILKDARLAEENVFTDDLRKDGRLKHRSAIAVAVPDSIDAGAAFCLGDGRTSGTLGGPQRHNAQAVPRRVRGPPRELTTPTGVRH